MSVPGFSRDDWFIVPPATPETAPLSGPATAAPIRVSIVEDHDATRRGLKSIIETAPGLELVSDYHSSEVAVASLATDRPQVVLMDINMPGLNGVECVRQLKPQLPETQFLMLTVYEDADHIFAALSAGATGYLLKGTRAEELLAAIEHITHGGSPMSSSIARKVVHSFVRTKAERHGVEYLSSREEAVLALLTKGYLYKEIADSLGVTVPTVCTHIRRIYEKLQVHSRRQAAATYLKHNS